MTFSNRVLRKTPQNIPFGEQKETYLITSITGLHWKLIKYSPIIASPQVRAREIPLSRAPDH